MPATPPLTSQVESLNSLFTKLYDLLNAYSGWTVHKFAGTSTATLFDRLPNLPLRAKPAAVLVWEKSDFYEHPVRHLAKFHVIVVKLAGKSLFTTGLIGAFDLAEEAIDRLDGQILTGVRAFVRADSAAALELGPAIFATDVVFSIGDP